MRMECGKMIGKVRNDRGRGERWEDESKNRGDMSMKGAKMREKEDDEKGRWGDERGSRDEGNRKWDKGSWIKNCRL